MEYYQSLPDKLAITASERVLAMVVKDHVARIIDTFPAAQVCPNFAELLASAQESPKLRHWLSVSRNLLRAKARTIDPEPRFMAHFEIDSLDRDRLAELHGFRAIEIALDTSLKLKKAFSINVENILCPTKWHIWNHGTFLVPENSNGLSIKIESSGSGMLTFGEHRVSLSQKLSVTNKIGFIPDISLSTSSGDVVIASNISGLGDAYHSNAPVIKSVTALKKWSETLEKAISILSEIDQELAAGCLRLSVAICPLHCGGTSFGSSSPGDIIGLVFLPGVEDPYDVAECLLHESLHQKLYHAEEGAQLFVGENGDHEIYYSPWRSDPRPLRMLVHGAFVFTGVAHLWKAIGASANDDDRRRKAAYHLYYRANQARRAMDVVAKYGEMTAFGSKVSSIVLDGINDVMEEFSGDVRLTKLCDDQLTEHLESHRRFKH